MMQLHYCHQMMTGLGKGQDVCRLLVVREQRHATWGTLITGAGQTKAPPSALLTGSRGLVVRRTWIAR